MQPRGCGGIPWLEILYIGVAVRSRLLLCEWWVHRLGGDPFGGSLSRQRNATKYTAQPYVSREPSSEALGVLCSCACRRGFGLV